MTREVRASEAKTKFGRLLDAVERGETIVLTRRGRRIARIVPEVSRSDSNTAAQRRRQKAIADITALGREIRKRNPDITLEEIISSIHEGHKY